jgi:two-component system cell cycle sensor histidine kinase/response regulator CckA
MSSSGVGLTISPEHLVAMLRDLPFYFSLIDEDDRMAWTSHSRVPLEQLIGKSVYEITEPALHGALREGLVTARAGGAGLWVGRSTIPGIGELTFRCTAHRMTEVDAVRYVVLVTENITDQRRAELALEASETRYRALLEAHPDYISDLDRERRFRSVNRVAHGLTAEQVLGHRVEEFLGPEAAVAIPIIERAFEDGTPGQFFGTSQLPEGKRIFDTRVLRVPPEHGEPRVMMITTDVTEAHAAAESIRSAEAQLARAQRLEMVGQLAGGVAHDFNNMLLVVQAHADLAQRRSNDPAVVKNCLDAIRTAVDRASELTGKLLATARRQTIATRPVELGALLDETIRLLERTLPQTIKIRRRGDATGWVQGDPDQLRQVLINLALNARDAMPSGGDLALELGPGPAGNSELRISVRDTGSGIAPELLGRVFEPFFTTKSQHLNSGLGLAVAQGIVRQHAGRLEVESEPGQGACFHLDLPAAHAPRIERIEPRATGTGAVILFAEDEGAVRQVVRAMLEEAGYQVLEAETGRAAIEILRRRADVSLAILDAVMPQGTGRDVHDVIAAERPGLPVLFTTGYSGGVFPGGIDTGPGVGLLRKPYAVDELLAEVSRLLVSSRTRPAR